MNRDTVRVTHRHTLAPGMTFVDAGANEGLYTVFAARRVGTIGRVWAFEPSAREFARLEQNVELNQLSNVRLFRLAHADRNASEDLLIADPDHAGQNTLGGFAHQGVQMLRRERITVRLLDNLVEEEGLCRLDVLKIDVEGAEVHLLDGAHSVLRNLRPVVLFEVSERALQLQGGSSDQLWKLFASVDYSIYAFDEKTGLPTPTGAAHCGGNMIGVPVERPLPDPTSFEGWGFEVQRR